jgi:hypothetical protein
VVYTKELPQHYVAMYRSGMMHTQHPSLCFFPLLSVLKNKFGDWDKSLQGNGENCKPRFWTVFAGY